MLGSNDRLRTTGEDQQQLSVQCAAATATVTDATTASSVQQHYPAYPTTPTTSAATTSRNPRSRSHSADERESVASSTSTSSSASSTGSDIQQHLQSMFYLLRPEETLKMAVKLESLRPGRTRYLVVVSRPPARPSRQQQTLLLQQQLHQATCGSSWLMSACSTPASVSPAPSVASMSKQITSASLYKAASPSTSTSVIAGYGGIGDETFVSNLDNCVLSTSLKATSVNAASNNNKSVDKCDSNRTSSCSTGSVVSAKPPVAAATAAVVATTASMTSTAVLSKSTSGFVSVTSSCTAGGMNRVISSSASLGSGSSSTSSISGSSKNQNFHTGGCGEIEESCLLGIDCNERTTVGLVLRVLADTAIRLDGDGGFSVSSCGMQHIFKPVSVQAMWSALQTLHKVSSKAREQNFFAGGSSHEWVSYYESHIDSDRSCLNEWHAMDSLESRRPPSPDSVRNKPTKREETECVIRTALKEIMMSVDLDVVTSKFIRGRLEEHLDMDLNEYKSFIDEEMLVILGQMDAPTEIFEHVYLGSEWNASNLEELQRNGVRHILNVTREIDNFFPGTFDYFNVRVYDDEKTDLLKHWDNTFKYISRARMEGSKVLVHCKMGISRSASVVIAYAMKANNWDFDQALRHVKEKRSCIKPNKNFIMQLETYQGMLDAMKNREKLQRSKSETNLKSGSSGMKDARLLPGSEPTPLIQALNRGSNTNTLNKSGRFLRKLGKRPKSWSPDTEKAVLLLEASRQQSHSLEHLMVPQNEAKTIRMPCGNGQNYSVSQNQIVHLQEGGTAGVQEETSSVPSALSASSVRSIISELESNKAKETSSNHKRKGSASSVASATGLSLAPSLETDEDNKDHLWDPGEVRTVLPVSTAQDSDTAALAQPVVCWTSQSQIIQQSSVQSVAASQPQPQPAQHVSRQSSWSSVDSAVVADMIRGTFSSASRNSSWGSGDNQGQRMVPAPPSRNSSWGSYDTSTASSIQTVVEVPVDPSADGTDEDLSHSGIFPYDKDEIPWHPGTVKRTKQKIEERSSSSIKRICSEKFGHQHPKIDESRGTNSQQRSNSEEVLPSNRSATSMGSSTYTRLSASAPGSYCLSPFGSKRPEEEQTSSKSHHRRFSFRKYTPDEQKKNDENTAVSVSGIVKNLKMSFEAKVNDRSKKEQKKGRSLPSSPVAIHIELSKQQQQHGQSAKQHQQQQEDITVRDLVDRYEAPRCRASFNTHHRHNSSCASTNTDQVVLRQRPRSVFEPLKYAQNQQKPLMISHSTTLLKTSTDDFSRPPPIPPAVVSGGGPFVRGIIIGSAASNTSQQAPPVVSGSGGTCSGPGAGTGTKKVIQHHGKTHPLAKINLTKHRINATSTTATAAYNTM
ncbi:protein phosphatase Slingshot isoform X2 [Malaya genurostris]|nr:protein phosphatase Slingshot isoform X2 [Malaya genurostris]XP_058444939.1 protein phosphatase Slingshot isoform X2 [Malaya genurostris]XP_058444940.1 protein phosphatase Slingshot isoform X2 [Malaya genurostris]XP_058444941.1 protein phosphatase Slingshot isoform X2 [Malaya genurostris]XP_058444942.1 protein phosphatase Slingshot isoform X2 [Malaya genurostris]